MRRIGIMGGTFDPIHNGHIAVGRQAYQEYSLEEVWFMPSGHPPHKRDHAVTDAEDRCEMTKLAIRDYPYFRFSDFEVKRQGNTYTAQTLTLLNEQYPDSRFFFIIGADSLFEIENWYMPERIMAQAVLLVAGRAYSRASRSLDDQILYLRERYHSEIYRLHLEEMDVASVRLRRMAAEGQNLRPYVPTAVWEYIKTHHLYEERQD
ncbi:MAG TPA: nicotinate-nucleotide adenylyltransferase [Candidatus Lachnoclostridium pullistercoris]|uniref:Probable nicotinate-nucleotide adenylyltransferase n=1 Tax=Candidatus Lachnoclostridium pullistercoris TaxID=2838632 RepID=A0A9D2T5E1_9FIRM|nr:nicotinate-nucleotide adenylyltransferase [Candidatus Lachnoclostridium pullistercoris]